MPIDQDELDLLWKTVFGNGVPGMDEQVRTNTTAIAVIQGNFAKLNTKVDAVNTAVQELARDRRDEKARREGSRDTLNWLKWGISLLLAVVLIGGSLGLWQVRTQWEAVQQQLQRIPSLPE